MASCNPQELLDNISEATGCNQQQVRAVVGRAFEALHKISFCHEMSVPAALGECMDQFGSKACYHLVGLLEQVRLCQGDQVDIPWSETYMRFCGQSYRESDPIVDGWMDERSEARKRLDARDQIWRKEGI